MEKQQTVEFPADANSIRIFGDQFAIVLFNQIGGVPLHGWWAVILDTYPSDVNIGILMDDWTKDVHGVFDTVDQAYEAMMLLIQEPGELDSEETEE